MSRLLFVGQAPSKESEGNPPFTGKCGKFLAELLGTTQEQMLLDHDFINVLNYWPGKGINGDLFPMDKARPAAKALIPNFQGRIVIFLGHNVARAYGVQKFEYFRWYEMRAPGDPNVVISNRVSIVPHPSGVNRFWNVPSNRDKVMKFFAGIVVSEKLPEKIQEGQDQAHPENIQSKIGTGE